MASSTTFVIVGGGLAGAKAVEALRRSDFGGRIILFGDEEHLPYDRPPLSKEFLAGKKSLSDFTIQTSDWYRDHDVDVRLGVRVSSLDRSAHTVELPDGAAVRYDKLLLATGSAPRRPPIPGSDAAGVHYLRSYNDAVALNSVLVQGSSLAVVGAGWIGLEVAASARQRGVDVTVVETAIQPLLAALGEAVGKVFADLHRDQGVDLRLQTQLEEITAADGKATGLKMRDGSTVAADAVLVAVGAKPNVELAQHRPGWRWARAVCWLMHRCAPAIPTSTQSATLPPLNTRYWVPASVPNTGPTRSNNPRWRLPACWAGRANTLNCPICSPINTTSAWSTSATPPAVIGWCSVATLPAASSSPSGSTATAGC